MSHLAIPESSPLTHTHFNLDPLVLPCRELQWALTQNAVSGILDNAWTRLHQLTAGDKNSPVHLLLKRGVQFSPETPLSVKVDSFYKLAETVNLMLGYSRSQPAIPHLLYCGPDYNPAKTANLELARSSKMPAIQNPFYIEQFIAANKRLKPILDESLMALWNQGVLHQLDKANLPADKIPDSPNAIRAFLNDPKNADRLAKITYLALNGPAYQALPLEISHFRGLKYLMLSELPLSRFAPDLTGLTELREIFLTKCRLSHFSADLSTCVNLQRLIVTNCHLQSFSPSSPLPFTLRSLDLSHNVLTSIPVDLALCPELRDIDLSNNKIKNLKLPLSGPLCLDKLDLTGNPLHNINVDLKGCKEVLYSPHAS